MQWLLQKLPSNFFRASTSPFVSMSVLEQLQSLLQHVPARDRAALFASISASIASASSSAAAASSLSASGGALPMSHTGERLCFKRFILLLKFRNKFRSFARIALFFVVADAFCCCPAAGVDEKGPFGETKAGGESCKPFLFCAGKFSLTRSV